jgi:Family of unknown function (DUF5335)
MAKNFDKAQWKLTFDAISKLLPAKRVEIETASLKLGDQVAAEWLPMIGLSYDPKDDLIEIALEGYDHLIQRPREVWIEGEGPDISSIEIVDAEDVRQIVLFRDPLKLPPPRKAAQTL